MADRIKPPMPGDIINGQRISQTWGGIPMALIVSDDLNVGDLVLFRNQLTAITKIRKPTRARIVIYFAGFSYGCRFHRRKSQWLKPVELPRAGKIKEVA